MAVQRGADKWKMKHWFSIKAPRMFNEAVIGEMPANDEKAALGRSITVSLDTLTKNPSHAYTNVVLRVVEVPDRPLGAYGRDELEVVLLGR